MQKVMPEQGSQEDARSYPCDESWSDEGVSSEHSVRISVESSAESAKMSGELQSLRGGMQVKKVAG